MVMAPMWLPEKERRHCGATLVEIHASSHSRLLQKAVQGCILQRHSERAAEKADRWWMLQATMYCGSQKEVVQISGAWQWKSLPHSRRLALVFYPVLHYFPKHDMPCISLQQSSVLVWACEGECHSRHWAIINTQNKVLPATKPNSE